MHSRDRAFNGVNFAQKDRMFLSGRGPFAGTSPVRATFPSSHLTLSLFYIVRSILQPSESLSPHLARLFLNGASRISFWELSSYYLTVFSLILILSLAAGHATFDSHSTNMLYSLQRYVHFRHFLKQFSFLMSQPTWIITWSAKKAPSFFPTNTVLLLNTSNRLKSNKTLHDVV